MKLVNIRNSAHKGAVCMFAGIILADIIIQLSPRLFLPLSYWRLTLVSWNDVKLNKLTNAQCQAHRRYSNQVEVPPFPFLLPKRAQTRSRVSPDPH